MQEQSLAPMCLDIVGQDSRGTNNVFECKQLIRFLNNKLGDKSSRKMDKMSKLIPWSDA